jgi:Uma2 family endonuclease
VSVTTKVRDTTADELLQLPDAGFRYELVRGELKKMAPAGSEHGNIAMDFGTLLNVHVRANKLGKVMPPRPASSSPQTPIPSAFQMSPLSASGDSTK